ncbi:MAG: hypothetical protein SF066_13090 [Thermoanaerobaculia bacterium]|nr:hypothetical protein [Thermoanaerobaculia bacterium]
MTKTKLAVSALALLAVVVAVIAFLPTTAEAGSSSSYDPSFVVETNASLPSCGTYDGLACTVGTRFRCMNAPFEPGMCFCPAGIFHCG